MTPEKCRYFLENGYFQAYIDGKLQYKRGNEWVTGCDLSFSCSIDGYRIAPQYKPHDFMSAIEDMAQNAYILRDKDGYNAYIEGIDKEGVVIKHSYPTGVKFHSFKSALENFTWPDGKVFGKEE